MKIHKKLFKILKFSYTEKKCYYEILDLKKDATKIEIKKKFIQLAKEYHPDINKEDSSQKIFKEISEAYGILSDEELKKQYDSTLNTEDLKFKSKEDFHFKKEDFEIYEEELKKKRNWENKKKIKEEELTKNYLDKKYFNNNYETKDPLNSWNFHIDLEKKKNDNQKKFVDSYTKFKGGEVYQYWEKNEDLIRDNNKYVYMEIFKEFGVMYNFLIAISGISVGLLVFYPELLHIN